MILSRTQLQTLTAPLMLLFGAGMSVAGFLAPPRGHISETILWLFAQCLIYAGSIFGVSTYVQQRFEQFRSSMQT